MATVDQTHYRQKGDTSTTEELLDTDEFINSVRESFGLIREKRTVCIHCGENLRQVDGKCVSCGNKAKGENTRVWTEKENAVMNKKGVDSFLSTLRAHVDRNQITSNFSRSEIQSVMEDFHVTWAEEIAREWDNYGIKNKPQALKIHRDGCNIIWSLFKRAQNGNTMDIIGGLSKDISKKVTSNEDSNNRGIGL